MSLVLIDEVNLDLRLGITVDVGVRHVARSVVGVGSGPITPIDDELGHRVITWIEDLAKRKGVGATFVDSRGAAEDHGWHDVGYINAGAAVNLRNDLGCGC